MSYECQSKFFFILDFFFFFAINFDFPKYYRRKLFSVMAEVSPCFLSFAVCLPPPTLVLPALYIEHSTRQCFLGPPPPTLGTSFYFPSSQFLSPIFKTAINRITAVTSGSWLLSFGAVVCLNIVRSLLLTAVSFWSTEGPRFV